MEVWIGRDGERLGPYPESDVRQRLRNGELNPADLGWYDGMTDWLPLSRLFPADVASTRAPPLPDTPSGPAIRWPSDDQVGLRDYAGFWKRVAAYILDGFVLTIPNLLVNRVFNVQQAEEALNAAQAAAGNDVQQLLQAFSTYCDAVTPALFAQLVIVGVYCALMESSRWQGTVGKRLMGIRVTDLQGQRISVGRAALRFLGKLTNVVLFGFGLLMVAWTQRKQGLHDMIAKTLVLNGRAPVAQDSTSASTPRDSFNA